MTSDVDQVVAALNVSARSMALSKMLGTACRLGVPDALDSDITCPTDVLATTLHVDSSMLTRLLRVLASYGIFSIDAADSVTHNTASLLLRRDHPRSIAWTVLFWSSDFIWNAWGGLDEAIRSGKEAFDQVHGRRFFEYVSQNRRADQLYEQYMSRGYPGRVLEVARRLPVGNGDIVIDVGGGTGELITELVRLHPRIQGVVFDRQEVLGYAEPPPERVRYDHGDFFSSVPCDGSAYVLSWILHDWSNDDAVRILCSCRSAMPKYARLFVVDRVIPQEPRERQSADMLLDIAMHVLHGARERTLAELGALLTGSGFKPADIVSSATGFSILATQPA